MFISAHRVCRPIPPPGRRITLLSAVAVVCLASCPRPPGASLVNLSTQRVKPGYVFGRSGGMDLLRRVRVFVAAELDVQNPADRAFVYNFGNSFSGTHFGYPRMYGGRLKFTFH